MLQWCIAVLVLQTVIMAVTANDSHNTATRRLKFLAHAKPRIVGGTPAAPGDYPFYVSTSGTTLCGGTLIAPDIVLTAAHCGGAFTDGVQIGGVRIDGTDAVELVAVDSEFPHPDFVFDTRVNDIMLVKLATPATSPVVQLNFNPAIPAEGDTLTVIGFGDTSFNGSPSNDLLTVNVDAYSDDFCFNLYNDFVPEVQVCAGAATGGRDSCQGDSGGPLLSASNQQLGVVSYGNGCGQANIPSVYTEVAAFQTFINQGICDLSATPPATCDSTAAPVIAPVSPPGTTPAPVDSPVSPPSNTAAPTTTPVVSPVSPPSNTAAPTTAPVDSPVAPPSNTAAPTTAPAVSPVTPPVNPVAPTNTVTPTITFQPTITMMPTITAQPTIMSGGPTVVPAPTVATTSPTAAPNAVTEPTLAPTDTPVAVDPTLAPTPEPTIPAGTDEPVMKGSNEPTITSTIEKTIFPSSYDGKGKGYGSGGKGGMMMGGGKGGKKMGSSKGHVKGGKMMGKGIHGIHYGKGLHINGNVLFHNDDDESSSSGENDLLTLIFGPSN